MSSFWTEGDSQGSTVEDDIRRGLAVGCRNLQGSKGAELVLVSGPVVGGGVWLLSYLQQQWKQKEE